MNQYKLNSNFKNINWLNHKESRKGL